MRRCMRTGRVNGFLVVRAAERAVGRTDNTFDQGMIVNLMKYAVLQYYDRLHVFKVSIKV